MDTFDIFKKEELLDCKDAHRLFLGLEEDSSTQEGSLIVLLVEDWGWPFCVFLVQPLAPQRSPQLVFFQTLSFIARVYPGLLRLRISTPILDIPLGQSRNLGGLLSQFISEPGQVVLVEESLRLVLSSFCMGNHQTKESPSASEILYLEQHHCPTVSI